jgi:hypothetical protein
MLRPGRRPTLPQLLFALSVLVQPTPTRKATTMAEFDSEALLAAMEQAATAVAQYTGIKNQLVAQGWNEHNAEKLVIEWVRAAGGNA